MEMSRDFAYFLGVMAGDGYVGKSGMIEIKSDNCEFLYIYSKTVKSIITKEPRIIKETNNKN